MLEVETIIFASNKSEQVISIYDHLPVRDRKDENWYWYISWLVLIDFMTRSFLLFAGYDKENIIVFTYDQCKKKKQWPLGILEKCI